MLVGCLHLFVLSTAATFCAEPLHATSNLTTSLQPVRELRLNELSPVDAISIAIDGSMIAATGRNEFKVQLYSISSAPIGTWRDSNLDVKYLRHSFIRHIKWLFASDQLICGGDDLLAWDIRRDQCQIFRSKRMEPYTLPIESLAISKSGLIAAVVASIHENSRTIHIWSSNEWRGMDRVYPVETIDVRGEVPTTVAFVHKNDNVLTCCNDGRLSVWNRNSGSRIGTFKAADIVERTTAGERHPYHDAVNGVWTGQQLSRVALCVNTSANVSLASIMSFDLDKEHTNKVAVKNVKRGNLPRGVVPRMWRMSADGSLVAVTDASGFGWVLDGNTGVTLCQFEDPKRHEVDDSKYSGFTALDINGLERIVVTGGLEGQILIWEIPKGK